MKRTLLGVAVIAVIVITAILIKDHATEKYAHVYPDYEKIDISMVLRLQKSELIEEHYTLLYYQTGLARPAVESILYPSDRSQYPDVSGIAFIEQAQDDFFREIEVVDEPLIIFTSEESIRGLNQGETGFQIAPLENGDIVATRGTHTAGWRHGHIGIVVDAENGIVLEAMSMGSNSTTQRIRKWGRYPNFILLRLKATEEERRKIAETAMAYAYDVPYKLLASANTKEDLTTGLSKTHCSHLVWWPFYMHGYDLNSSGSWIVTPRDIVKSDELEIVQIYGFHPEILW